MPQVRIIGVTIEEPLLGGMDNAGSVVRVGDTVRRPTKPWSDAVGALLVHLEQVGFDGAPRYFGRDGQGREILSYIDGDVPLPPYPSWSMSEDALTAMGHLVRRFHAATASFDATSVAGWAVHWADPAGGPVICHNDLFPENTVFRDGRPVALIDFDMVAPGRPFWDVAIAAHEWGPLSNPATRWSHPRELEGVARVARFARAYGVAPDDAPALVDMIFLERSRVLEHIREQIAEGNEVWTEHWRETDGANRADADDAWLAAHREALIDAIAGGRARAAN